MERCRNRVILLTPCPGNCRRYLSHQSDNDCGLFTGLEPDILSGCRSLCGPCRPEEALPHFLLWYVSVLHLYRRAIRFICRTWSCCNRDRCHSIPLYILRLLRHCLHATPSCISLRDLALWPQSSRPCIRINNDTSSTLFQHLCEPYRPGSDKMEILYWVLLSTGNWRHFYLFLLSRNKRTQSGGNG